MREWTAKCSHNNEIVLAQLPKYHKFLWICPNAKRTQTNAVAVVKMLEKMRETTETNRSRSMRRRLRNVPFWTISLFAVRGSFTCLHIAPFACEINHFACTRNPWKIKATQKLSFDVLQRESLWLMGSDHDFYVSHSRKFRFSFQFSVSRSANFVKSEIIEQVRSLNLRLLFHSSAIPLDGHG